jgi:hypothetical protein
MFGNSWILLRGAVPALGLVGASLISGLAPARGAAASPTTCAWNIVSSPNTDMPANVLRGVTAVTANDVWAVGDGSQNPIDPGITLIVHWDGSAWSIISSPTLRGAKALLNGVSATSSDDVWAVGEAVRGGNAGRTLTEHWNGRRWRIVPSPSVSNVGNVLTSVVAIAPNDVWAAGYTTTFATSQTLTLHWDGAGWSIVPSPSPGSFDNRLMGVTALATDNVWAAGESTTGEEHNLIEQWTGNNWSVVPSPPFPNTNVDFMESISAASAGDIWAVGGFTIPNSEGSPTQTAILHWDGTSWNIVPSPNPSASFDVLTGVVAISADNAWAVGTYLTVPLNTLIEHWNGANWNVLPSPPASSAQTELLGIAAVSSTDIWSVGGDQNGRRTLVEHFTCQ